MKQIATDIIGVALVIVFFAAVIFTINKVESAAPVCLRMGKRIQKQGGYYDKGLFRQPVWLEPKETEYDVCIKWSDWNW